MTLSIVRSEGAAQVPEVTPGKEGLEPSAVAYLSA
jgi:hypothetical protein